MRAFPDVDYRYHLDGVYISLIFLLALGATPKPSLHDEHPNAAASAEFSAAAQSSRGLRVACERIQVALERGELGLRRQRQPPPPLIYGAKRERAD